MSATHPFVIRAPLSQPGPSLAPLPHDIYARRRTEFLRRLGGGVAVLPAAPELLRPHDAEVRYRADTHLFYLSGFTEPDAVAVLTPHDEEHRFTLFVRPRDPERESWTGRRIGVEGAREQFGADAAYPIAELDEHLRQLVEPADRLVCALGENAALDGRVTELLKAFRRSRTRSGRGPALLEDPEPILGEMRMVKEPAELERIRAAAVLAALGHRAAMAAARPGVGEWELQAVFEATIRLGGAAGPAFPTIVGSGPSATVLHYTANDRRAAEGELVLLDAGAELDMYCSDISRTFPVSGRFTPPQRAVYDVVLAAEEAAIAAVRPGAPFDAIHAAAVRTLVDGMLDLGILAGDPDTLIEEEAHKRFYMHRTSHWLGLDVHDTGPYRRDDRPVILSAGMVLTIEPGLYIPEDADDVPPEFRGIGIRIEDDVEVTPTGHTLLTRGVPVAPDEIEALVGA